jgi:uncharacterized protein
MASCTIEIRLKPRAKSDRITIAEAGQLDIAVTSPPVDNAANEHLIKLLAGRLRVPKSSMRLIRGGHSKNKVIAIDGLTIEQVMKKMENG